MAAFNVSILFPLIFKRGWGNPFDEEKKFLSDLNEHRGLITQKMKLQKPTWIFMEIKGQQVINPEE